MEVSTELRDLMLHFYVTISQGDLSILDKLLSHQTGVLWIGTDPQEWWDHRDAVLRAWTLQTRELGGPVSLRPGNLQAHRHGDVGWVADQPLGRLPDGTLVLFRITAVFEREAMGWKMVQVHASIGSFNEDVTGIQLTT
jgi:ketosteroid isomerase-like protein